MDHPAIAQILSGVGANDIQVAFPSIVKQQIDP